MERRDISARPVVPAERQGARRAPGCRSALFGPAAFPDAQTEQIFLGEFRRSGAKFAQLAFFAGAAAALAFALLMTWFPDRYFDKQERQLIRVALAILLASAALVVTLCPRLVARRYVLAVGAPAALACLTVAALGFLPPDVDLPRSGRLTVAMCLTCYLVYGFARLPPAAVAAICSLASVVAIVAATVSADDYPEALALYLAVTNLSGWILAVQIEKRERDIFAKALALRQGAAQLELSARISAEADATKSHVLAAVSHDLRQPLASMSLYLSALRSASAHGSIQGCETVARIDECVAAMKDNLSRLSNIAELRDRHEPFPVGDVDLRVLFTRLACVHGGQAADRGVRLVIAAPDARNCLVRSNGARLWEVLSNLVSNAIKFADRSRPAWVVVATTRLGTDLRITVRDNGIGIASNFHRRVFDEYFQLGDSPRSRAGGYGLGLSIVRETTSRLPSHRLRMRSESGQGARFDVLAPRAMPFVQETPAMTAAQEGEPEVRYERNRRTHGRIGAYQ